MSAAAVRARLNSGEFRWAPLHEFERAVLAEYGLVGDPRAERAFRHAGECGGGDYYRVLEFFDSAWSLVSGA